MEKVFKSHWSPAPPQESEPEIVRAVFIVRAMLAGARYGEKLAKGSAHAKEGSMALAVFMRAVNVGGFQKFQPAALAKKLADLDVVNIGAAGTFVIRARVSEKALRKQMLAEMGFEPAMMVVSADD